MLLAILLGAGSLAATVRADCQWQKERNILLQEVEPTCPREASNTVAGWQGPASCVGETCLYWRRDFDGGRGIALVTTAKHAREVAAFSDALRLDHEEEPYYRAEIPGKGNGLLAKRDIVKGETIMINPASLIVRTETYKQLTVAQANELYTEALEKVSEQTKQEFLGQYGHDLHTKVDKNGFTIFTGHDQDSQHIGVFPHVSGFNHDCRPSVSYRLNNITHTATTVRDIKEGEELSISYIDLMLPREERRERLRDWGFECTCRHCSLGPREAAASDANIERIRRIEEELDSPDGKVTVDTGLELVALYEAERLDIYLGPAYTRAALNYGLFGDEKAAREYAAKAIAALERQYGPDAADLPSMRALRADPRTHWSWALRTTRTMHIPFPENLTNKEL